jgi:ubiquinone/menaquinone biosynthesis C-methylase UbiE/uncharacterized protein YbaR (Trm112 family)
MFTMTASSAEFETQRAGNPSQALAVYVCPSCKGGLAIAPCALRCDLCQRTYPVRHGIPNFLEADSLRKVWRHSTNSALRHADWFDWLALIYETSFWYPLALRFAGVTGIASLAELRTIVDETVGTVSGDVLDVACGPGTFGRRIAPHADSVFGIDISIGMLERGRRYAQREQVTNISFARARVEALPFSPQTFAAALCCGSLHLFEDPVLALREIARTLQPSALLVGFTFTGTNTGLARFARRHGARVFDVQNLGDLLQRAGFAGYAPRTFGSGLLFSARKNEAPALHRGA